MTATLAPRGSRTCACCHADFEGQSFQRTCEQCRADRKRACRCGVVFVANGKERLCPACAPAPSADVQAFLRYLKARNASPNTVKAYGRDLAMYSTFCTEQWGASWTWTTATREAGRAFLGWVQRQHGYGKRSTARVLAGVKAFYKWMMREDDSFPSVPILRTRSPKHERHLTEQPTGEALDRVFAVAEGKAARGGFYAARNLAMLEVFYSTGIRLSELTGLDVGDVELAAGQARIRHGKGDKERIVPLGGAAVRALKRWLALRKNLIAGGDEQAVFVSIRRDRLAPTQIQKFVHGMFDAADVKGYRVHSLRHACATHMMDAGAGIREIQELLGHASISSTAVYTHVSVERLKEAYMRCHPRANRSLEVANCDPG